MPQNPLLVAGGLALATSFVAGHPVAPSSDLSNDASTTPTANPVTKHSSENEARDESFHWPTKEHQVPTVVEVPKAKETEKPKAEAAEHHLKTQAAEEPKAKAAEESGAEAAEDHPSGTERELERRQGHLQFGNVKGCVIF